MTTNKLLLSTIQGGVTAVTENAHRKVAPRPTAAVEAEHSKSKPKFKVYGVLEMWEAYHLGKNDGTIKDMEYLLSKKVE